ncbi:MAG: DUF4038 domain-containing protein [Proteobacteria bacterium]|nr:DUF4038 domain-containing protein [Pseudomonadota bacterium]
MGNGRACRAAPPRRRFRLAATALMLVLLAARAAAGGTDPAYPLRPGPTGRYLVDRNGTPFLMIGDAPQAAIAKLSPDEADAFMANRARYGVNTLWMSLLCNQAEDCRADAATADGIAPFLEPDDLATPNEAYFARADALVRRAGAYGMTVLLDPIETSGWLPVLRANGLDKAFAYGRYLGTRFAGTANIIWMSGNDFQTWTDPADDRLVQAVARGIRSVDREHLQTAELNYTSSGTLDDESWAPLIGLDAAYTYLPAFAQVMKEYGRPDFRPVFLVESNYEFEHLPFTDGGSPPNMRRQNYWAMLSGATGAVYGSGYDWRLRPGWKDHLDTQGIRELRLLKAFFSSRRWFDLVPDRDHATLTSGYGWLDAWKGGLFVHSADWPHWASRLADSIRRRTDLGSIAANGYVAAARTPDGTLAVAYLPEARRVTVDMGRLARPARARWFDPTDGTYRDAAAGAVPNSGERTFRPPGKNAAGDEDWVLVLEAPPPG